MCLTLMFRKMCGSSLQIRCSEESHIFIAVLVVASTHFLLSFAGAGLDRTITHSFCNFTVADIFWLPLTMCMSMLTLAAHQSKIVAPFLVFDLPFAHSLT